MYNFCDSGEDGENIRYLNEDYKAFGISTSVQSIIIRVEGYFSLNCSGMCLFIISLVGHMGTSLSLKYKRHCCLF